MSLKKIIFGSPLLFLFVLGGRASVVAVVLSVVLALLKIIPWEYLLYAGIVLMPVKTLGMIDVGFRMQWSQLFLVGAVFVAVVDRYSDMVPKQHKFDFRIILVFLVIIISSFQSVYIPLNPVVILGAYRNYPWIKSLTRIMFLLALFSLAIVIRTYAVRKDAFFRIMRVVFFSSSVHAGIGLMGFILFFFGIKNVWGVELVTQASDELQRIRGFEFEPLFFGAYLLTMTPVMIVLALGGENDLMNKRLLRVLAVINTAALLLTSSRGVWAGCVMSMVFLSVINYQQSILIYQRIVKKLREIGCFVKRQSILRLILLGIMLFVIMINLAKVVTKTVIDPITGAFNPAVGKFWSTRLRLMTIGIGLDAFLSHPFLGIGYENFSFYAGNIFMSDVIYFAINYPDVNSLPIKILVETGIIGSLIICWVGVTLFLDIARMMKKAKDVTLKRVLQGYCAALVGIGTQYFFFSNVLLTYLWVMFGLILAVTALVEQEK